MIHKTDQNLLNALAHSTAKAIDDNDKRTYKLIQKLKRRVEKNDKKNKINP